VLTFRNRFHLRLTHLWAAWRVVKGLNKQYSGESR
jgi:hypothetical protein